MKKLNAMNNERMKQAYSIVEDMRKEVEVYKARVSQLFESVSGLSHHEFLWGHVANLGRPFDQQNVPITTIIMAGSAVSFLDVTPRHYGAQLPATN